MVPAGDKLGAIARSSLLGAVRLLSPPTGAIPKAAVSVRAASVMSHSWCHSWGLVTPLVTSHPEHSEGTLSRAHLTRYFLVRPLGFEPRTCGLRVSSEPFPTIPDRPGQAHYQGLQSLSVADRR